MSLMDRFSSYLPINRNSKSTPLQTTNAKYYVGELRVICIFCDKLALVLNVDWEYSIVLTMPNQNM